MADLFLLTDLTPLVGGSLDTALATAARDVATGVVLGYCRLSAVPDTPNLALVAVAKRVAARVYANPSDLRSETAGAYAASYNSLLDPTDQVVLDFVAALSGSGRALSVALDY